MKDDNAERAGSLAQTRALFDAVWESAGDAMVLSDAEGIVEAANPAYCRLYGYSPAEVTGHSFAIIFPEEIRTWAVEQYKMAFEGPLDTSSVESTVRRKDGATRIVGTHYSFLMHNGRRTAMISLIRDLTEHKLAEAELARLAALEHEARAAAEKAIISRDELIAAVSHDLKNPLTVISGNTQLLKRRLERARSENMPGADIQQIIGKWLERIEVTSAKMMTLLDELTDFSILQERQMLPLRRSRTDLVALTHEIVKEYQETDKHHHVRFEADERSIVGTWDADRLERVIGNLVSNAIKYSPKGAEINVNVVRAPGRQDIHAPVRESKEQWEGELTEASKNKEWAVLTVRDEGIGIPDDDIPHIFEWFRRASNVPRRTGGAGIGLANVRQIVEQHEGSIRVDSREGQGSTFIVRLPLA